MSHMTSYTRGASRSGHSQNECRTQTFREPTRAEYIALTMAAERKARTVQPKRVSLGGPEWSR